MKKAGFPSGNPAVQAVRTNVLPLDLVDVIELDCTVLGSNGAVFVMNVKLTMLMTIDNLLTIDFKRPVAVHISRWPMPQINFNDVSPVYTSATINMRMTINLTENKQIITSITIQ